MMSDQQALTSQLVKVWDHLKMWKFRDTLKGFKGSDGEPYYDNLDSVLELVGQYIDYNNFSQNFSSLSTFDDESSISKIRDNRKYRRLRLLANENCSYHNGNHWDNVAKIAKSLAEYQSLQRSESILLELFSMFHDVIHEGKIRGMDWKRNVEPSIIWTWHFCTELEMPQETILKVVCMMSASTAHDDYFKEENSLSRTAVMADLGTIAESFQEFLESSINVHLEIPTSNRTEDFASWCTFQKNFCVNYVGPRLQLAVNQKLVPPFWIDASEEKLKSLTKLANSTQPRLLLADLCSINIVQLENMFRKIHISF